MRVALQASCEATRGGGGEAPCSFHPKIARQSVSTLRKKGEKTHTAGLRLQLSPRSAQAERLRARAFTLTARKGATFAA